MSGEKEKLAQETSSNEAIDQLADAVNANKDQATHDVHRESAIAGLGLEQDVHKNQFKTEVGEHKKQVEKVAERSNFAKFFDSTGGKALMWGTAGVLARKFILKPVIRPFSKNKDVKKDENENKDKDKTEDKDKEDKENKENKEETEDIEKMSLTQKIKHVAKKALLYGAGASALRYAIKKLVFEKKSVSEAMQDLIPSKTESTTTTVITTPGNGSPAENSTTETITTTTPTTETSPTTTPVITKPADNSGTTGDIPEDDDNTKTPDVVATVPDDTKEDSNESDPSESDEVVLEDSEVSEEASLLNEHKAYTEELSSIKAKEATIYNKGMLPFGKFVKTYGTSTISHEALATANTQLREIFSNNEALDGEGLVQSIMEYKQQLQNFKASPEDSAYHTEMTQKVDQWLLTIADAFEYNLNKNLKAYPIAIEIYSSFVNQIKGKNPEKTKDLTMPQIPSEEAIMEHIKKNSPESDYNKVRNRILDHGVESLLAPNPTTQKHSADILTIFNTSLDVLNQQYKQNLHDVMKKFDGIKGSLTLTPSEKKALNGAIDHLGASGNYFFGLLDLDWENESSARIIQTATGIVLVVGGVVVTIASLGTGTGVGAAMVAGGVGLASAIAITKLNTYVTGVDATRTDYGVEGTLGAATMGMSKYFTGARIAMRSIGASKLQFAKSYSREIFTNLGLYSGADLVRGNLSWEGTAHNLARALLPAFLDTKSARKMLRRIPERLKGLEKSKMAHYMQEFEVIQKLSKSTRPGDAEKAKKLLEQLNKKLANERLEHSNKIREYITQKEKEWSNFSDQAQELHETMKKKGGFDKLSPEEQKLRKELHVKSTAIQQEIQLMESFQTQLLDGDTAAVALNGLQRKIIPSLKAGDPASAFMLDDKFTLTRSKNGKLTLDEKKGGLSLSQEFDNDADALKHIARMFEAKPSLIARNMTYGIEQMGGNIHVLNGKKISIVSNGKKQKYTLKTVEKTDANGIKTTDIEVHSASGPIDPQELKTIESTLQNKIMKELDSKYLLLTKNVTWMNSPLSKMGSSETWKKFWDSDFGVKLQHYAGTLGQNVTSWTLGDFLGAVEKIKYRSKEGVYMQQKGFGLATNDFMELAMGKGTLSKSANLIMMYSLMASNDDESTLPLPLQYMYYRVLGIPVIGYELMQSLAPSGKALYDYVAPQPSDKLGNVDLE